MSPRGCQPGIDICCMRFVLQGSKKCNARIKIPPVYKEFYLPPPSRVLRAHCIGPALCRWGVCTFCLEMFFLSSCRNQAPCAGATCSLTACASPAFLWSRFHRLGERHFFPQQTTKKGPKACVPCNVFGKTWSGSVLLPSQQGPAKSEGCRTKLKVVPEPRVPQGSVGQSHICPWDERRNSDWAVVKPRTHAVEI